MPNWYWEKKDLRATPSQEKGLDFGTEARYRREGVRFIMEMGKALNLSHNTMATGAVYYHRFYMFHTFQDFPKFPVATCCLFLAGKAEETPKKCRDLIRTVRQLTNDRQFETFGVDPREEIMALERVLLQTIHFDLQVDHPYASIIKYAKTLKGDKNKLQKMVQMSWTFVNDSLCTTLCLQWEPEIVAIAVMYLAVKLSKFEVKDWMNRLHNHVNWWDQFVDDLEASDLEEICHQVLDLYMQPTQPAREAAASPPPSANPIPAVQVNPLPTSSPQIQTNLKPQKITPPPTSKARSPAVPKSRPQTPPPSKSKPLTPPPPMPPSTAAISGANHGLAKPPLPPTTVSTVMPVITQVAYHPSYVLAPQMGASGPVPPPSVAYSYPPNYPPPISQPPVIHPHYQQPYNFPPPPGQPYYPGAIPPPAPPTTFHRGPPPPPPPNPHSHSRY